MYKFGEQIRLTSVIRRRLSPELLIKIERTSRRYDLNNNRKGKIILRLLKDNGVEFRFLGQGTNRMGIQIDDLVFKIALDDDGHIDNKREFKYTKDLQPYVIKVYECTEDGLIAVTEMVTCFDDYDYMLQKQDEIRKILRDVGNEYFIGDVGITEKNAANWGTRSNGELVMLDFAYIYSVSYRLFTCTCKDQEILQYDKDYNKLECPACHRIIDFAQIRRRISKADQANEIGDLSKQAYVLHKDVEFQKVNPEFSEVEEPKDTHKKEDKKMSKKHKIHMGKNFDKIDTEDQIDLMTKILMGESITGDKKEIHNDVDDDDMDIGGDSEEGARLMEAALMNMVNKNSTNDDSDDVVPAYEQNESVDDDEEPESPVEYSASDYMSMASEMLSEQYDQEETDSMAMTAEMLDDQSESEEDAVDQDIPVIEEDVNSSDDMVDEETIDHDKKTETDIKAEPNQLMLSDTSRGGIQFSVYYGNDRDKKFTSPNVNSVMARHTGIINTSTNHPFSSTGLADKLATAIISVLNPVLICTGTQLDSIIFPSMIGDAISTYDAKRFKIIEVMGDRDTAPANRNLRFFAVYDLGHIVKDLEELLYKVEGTCGDYVTADFVKCTMATVHMMLNTCTAPMDLDAITILGEDSTISNYLADDSKCRLMHDFIIDDHNTTMATSDDSVFTFDVGSWDIDDHDSDIPTMDDILNSMIPALTEDLTNILNGYEGASSDIVLGTVLNLPEEVGDGSDDESDDNEDDSPVAQIIEDVNDADDIGFDENFRIDTVSKV